LSEDLISNFLIALNLFIKEINEDNNEEIQDINFKETRILYERMQKDKKTIEQRPNLTDEKDPFQEMLDTVKNRHYNYAFASHALAYTEGKTVKEVAEEISVLVR